MLTRRCDPNKRRSPNVRTEPKATLFSQINKALLLEVIPGYSKRTLETVIVIWGLGEGPFEEAAMGQTQEDRLDFIRWSGGEVRAKDFM